MIGVLALAELEDARIDLHRVDRLDLVRERVGRVRPAAGPDHQRVPESPARKPLVDLVIKGLGGGLACLHRVHRLMRDPVHGDHRVRPGLPQHGDPVIRRPEIAAGGRADHQSARREDEGGVNERKPGQAARERETREQKREDAEPHRRLQAQE